MTCLDYVFDSYSFKTHYLVAVLMTSGTIIMLNVVLLNVLNGCSHWRYVYISWDDTTKGVAVVMRFRRVQYRAII